MRLEEAREPGSQPDANNGKIMSLVVVGSVTGGFFQKPFLLGGGFSVGNMIQQIGETSTTVSFVEMVGLIYKTAGGQVDAITRFNFNALRVKRPVGLGEIRMRAGDMSGG